MDTAKPTKTLADYLVIAISPVLIMVLVHSLCFFLVAVFLPGEAAGGVRWVLFWFVLAVVLIARIGIEQGDTNAMIYGLFWRWPPGFIWPRCNPTSCSARFCWASFGSLRTR